MSDDVLDFLLADFQRHALPPLTPRALRLPDVPNRALTLIGMRRVGKTYAPIDRMQRLLAAGVAKERLLHRSQLAALVDAYLERGGFPEVQRLHPSDRLQALQQDVELVLLKDVAERHQATNFAALRHLVRGLFAANAGPFSVSRFHGTLASQGLKVAKPTLLAYLDHLCDASLVFLVPLRSRSEKRCYGQCQNGRSAGAAPAERRGALRAPGFCRSNPRRAEAQVPRSRARRRTADSAISIRETRERATHPERRGGSILILVSPTIPP